MITSRLPGESERSISTASIPYAEKLRELVGFFRMRVSDLLNPHALDSIFTDIGEYEDALRKYSGIGVSGAKGLDIGFGARPLRLLALAGLGADVAGVDLDVPLIRGTPREVYDMYRRNGMERAIKSLIRFACFDIVERRRLAAQLRKRGSELRIDPRRLRVQDAITLELPDKSLDFIYAEDVFEHIPVAGLRKLVPKMAGWLKPSGLALIRPCIFTGISGGHLAEWFPNKARRTDLQRRSAPWEHLRQRRFKPNAYLNELPRVGYREIFSQHFEILEEHVRAPQLGRDFLTAEVARELVTYSHEELFSNQVLFVLRPLSSSSGS
jgi:hypothetical protein